VINTAGLGLTPLTLAPGVNNIYYSSNGADTADGTVDSSLQATMRYETGLVAAYSFSKDTVQGGQLLDISGNGNHGTISGAMLSKDGMNKDGMKFDGVDDYVNLGDDSTLTASSGGFSIATRFKLEQLGTPQRLVANGGQTNTTYDYGLGLTSGNKLVWAIGKTSGLIPKDESTMTFELGKIYDVVATFDGTTKRVYVNGQQITMNVSAAQTNTAISQTWIGARNSGNFFFKGEIYDAQFHNYEKTADQAKAYHNSFITPQIIEDFQNHPVGDTSPKGWNKGTGSYVVKEGKDDFDTNSYHYPCSTSEDGWQRCADDTGTDEGANGVGQALKEVGLGTGVGEGTDLVGFASKFSGNRDTNGSFYNLSSSANFWSSTPSGSANAWRRYLYSSYSSILRYSYSRAFGYSLRCLRDTNDTSDFTDPRDGNVYECVRIGNQVWMTRNLAYLPEVTPTASWGSTSEAQYAVYDYTDTDVAEAKETTNYQTHGVLYNYDAAIISAPEGFHVPSDEEWNILERYVFEKIIGEKYRFLECTSNGTITIPLDLDSFTDNGYIEIDRFITNWQTHKGTVSDLNSESWFDYSDKKITLTATAGERFANIKIFNSSF